MRSILENTLLQHWDLFRNMYLENAANNRVNVTNGAQKPRKICFMIDWLWLSNLGYDIDVIFYMYPFTHS